MVSTQLAIVLLLLAAAIVMFALNKPRMDAVGLITLTILPFTGALTMSEALSGFSDPNVVLIAALFVIGEGLIRTGVVRRLGDWLTTKAGSSEIRLIVLLMVAVSALGAVMSSTAVTAIFVPVALRIAQKTRTSPSRLMMPLCFAALISGMMTLVATTPNLVVNSELVREGSEGLRFFSFTPFGLPILVLGIIYMIITRRWLGGSNEQNAAEAGRPSLQDWIKEYRLADREYRVRVTEQSPLVGKAVGELDLPEVGGARLVAIERKRRPSLDVIQPAVDVIQPTSKVVLQADDVLLIDLFELVTGIDALRKKFALDALPLSGAYFSDRSQEIGMAEVMIPPDSELIGKSADEAQFRTNYGLTVIGLRRGVVARERFLNSEPLRRGDTLLLIGPWKAIRNVRSKGKDLVILNLPAELEDVPPVRGKALHAICVLLLVIGLMVSGVVPNVQAALIGCLLMGALGCVDFASAYRAIDWKTIVLIVGMLPFSVALHKTGGVDLGANALMSIVGGSGTYVVLASLFAITALLGLFISNSATAVLMAPVAIAIADELAASRYPFVMIVALAASTAFMTPISSPVNTLVVTPGEYTFADFVRVGVPFSLVVMVVIVFMVPWLLPLYPK